MVSRQPGPADRRQPARNRKARGRADHRLIFEHFEGVVWALWALLVPRRDGKLADAPTGDVGGAHQRAANRGRSQQHLVESIRPRGVCRSHHHLTIFSGITLAAMLRSAFHQQTQLQRDGDPQFENQKHRIAAPDS